MKLRWFVTTLLLLAVARGARAQTGAIVSYQLDVFDIATDQNGVGKPLWTATIPAASIACNLAPLPAPVWLTAPNPQVVYWNDPANAGKICRLTTVLLGTLPTNAPGAYVLTVSVTDDRGATSTRSKVSGPFNSAPPLPVAGVGVR